MARRREVERAKKQFLAETENRDWVQGVGIGRVDRYLGLIVSVRPGTKPAASRILNRLELAVPVRVRAVADIRSQSPTSLAVDAKSFEFLRNAANSRLNKGHD
jgi:hypothetical protein